MTAFGAGVDEHLDDTGWSCGDVGAAAPATRARRGRAARPAALLFLATAVHAAGGTGFGPGGPDVLLLTVAAVAAVSDRDAAAAFGFAAGLAADLFLSTPFGLCAFAYTLVGWAGAAGAAGGDRPAGASPAGLASASGRAVRASLHGGATCLAGGALVIAMSAALGAAPWPRAGALAAPVIGCLAAAACAPPVFAAVRGLNLQARPG